jgi:hypothetical protein
MNEAVDGCGCRLERTENGLHMVDCPLHKAALDLLEMLIELESHATKYGGIPKSATLLWDRVRAVIAKTKEP